MMVEDDNVAVGLNRHIRPTAQEIVPRVCRGTKKDKGRDCQRGNETSIAVHFLYSFLKSFDLTMIGHPANESEA